MRIVGVDDLVIALATVPWIRRSRQAKSHCYFHQVGDGVSVHLLHHLSSVSLHSDLTYPELQTNLLVQHSSYD